MQWRLKLDCGEEIEIKQLDNNFSLANCQLSGFSK